MSTQTFINMLLTALIAVGLGSSYLLDQGEPAYTPAQADAIAAAQAAAKRERAARDLCDELYGPQSAHLWDAAGSLICITRRGEELPSTPVASAGL